MANLLFTDQHILANDESWKTRTQQAVASASFSIIQENNSGYDYFEAKARQELAKQVIGNPERHTARIAILLATNVPDSLVTIDGSVVTVNNVNDTQLLDFINNNWSKLAGVGSDLPDIT